MCHTVRESILEDTSGSTNSVREGKEFPTAHHYSPDCSHRLYNMAQEGLMLFHFDFVGGRNTIPEKWVST